MSVMFHHTWTYQALVHDLLDMKLNKVRLQQEVEGSQTGKKETKTYDLDSSADFFWQANAGNPWPRVVGMLNCSGILMLVLSLSLLTCWRVEQTRSRCRPKSASRYPKK